MNLSQILAEQLVRRVTAKKVGEGRGVPLSPVQQTQVAEAVAPIIVNATNNEPWFQSRVTLGSLFAGFGAVGTLGLMFTRGEFDPETFSVSLTTLAGIGFALYGRWKAKKPIGS